MRKSFDHFPKWEEARVISPGMLMKLFVTLALRGFNLRKASVTHSWFVYYRNPLMRSKWKLGFPRKLMRRYSIPISRLSMLFCAVGRYALIRVGFPCTYRYGVIPKSYTIVFEGIKICNYARLLTEKSIESFSKVGSNIAGPKIK